MYWVIKWWIILEMLSEFPKNFINIDLCLLINIDIFWYLAICIYSEEHLTNQSDVLFVMSRLYSNLVNKQKAVEHAIMIVFKNTWWVIELENPDFCLIDNWEMLSVIHET